MNLTNNLSKNDEITACVDYLLEIERLQQELVNSIEFNNKKQKEY